MLEFAVEEADCHSLSGLVAERTEYSVGTMFAMSSAGIDRS